MPFARPPLSALQARARQSFNDRLAGVETLLRQNNVRVSADVMAELMNGIYGYVAWIVTQLFPDIGEAEFLERWGRPFGVTRLAATAAIGEATFTGTNGTVILAGTVLQTADRQIYATTAEVTISAGTATAPIAASAPGAAGNQDAGVPASLVSPIGGVSATAAIAAPGLTGGADEESDDSLRARVMLRWQEPPHGGAEADYETWALEVPGVTRAWPSAKEMGVGTVTLRFMMDDVRADDDGIPQGDSPPDAYSGDLLAVYNHLTVNRPATADLFVVAPIATPLDVEIADLAPDTLAVRNAIEAEIRDFLRREAKPAGTIRLSRLGEAISAAVGEGHHTLVSPAADVTHTTGQIAVLGDLDFT
jgi:uncharacterized phage protein gp47/JayE